ncbi:actinorhodin polyketide beta-ketoacyl synthase [Sphaerisporangium rufum]|uniref:Actinorhodin polyketide beta-ketoacyl synthase n=1 Tax=Sphaerisporangium rufum TaxID=1381558 RepID=A0A919R854_9ACTN|nr:ketosynthase chain-length factor [Sphaerisporangium rufum]GII80978.1 actinorhodin polyketide beta-ketoacyl synthase [Sphaerisporangium rufum]
MTAVITGVGVVAPTGIGVEEHWTAVVNGDTAIRPISRFDASGYPVRHAGEIREFDAAERVPSLLVPQTDHWTHLGFQAAEMALADAGVDPAELPEYEMAVVTAASSGGTEFGQKEIQKLWSKGSRAVGAYQSIAWFYAASTGQISIRHGMRGPCGVIANEQAGGLDVLAQARRMLRNGAKVVVSGGTDASLCPYGLTAQLSSGLLSRDPDPARAFRPFTPGAAGYLPGEGGGKLIIEDAAHAAARGVRAPYGEVAGYAATFDPPPRSGRPPTLRRAIDGALADAAITAAEVDVVFADAMGEAGADLREAAAISAVFGPYGVPVAAPKVLTGRLYAGGAPLDVITALMCMRDGIVPAVPGGWELDPEQHIDLVQGEPRRMPVRTVLVLARGYGGFNAALVLRAP